MDNVKLEALTELDKLEPISVKDERRLAEFYHSVIQAFVDAFEELCDKYPHKRSLHLCKHGSYRVRKKNATRFGKWCKRHFKSKGLKT